MYCLHAVIIYLYILIQILNRCYFLDFKTFIDECHHSCYFHLCKQWRSLSNHSLSSLTLPVIDLLHVSHDEWKSFSSQTIFSTQGEPWRVLLVKILRKDWELHVQSLVIWIPDPPSGLWSIYMTRPSLLTSVYSYVSSPALHVCILHLLQGTSGHTSPGDHSYYPHHF